MIKPNNRAFARGKTIQPPCGRRKCIPPLVAGALWTSPAGLRVDGPLGRRFLRGLSLTRPAAVRVLKFDGALAPRVLKFDSGSAAEGCCGRFTFIEGALL